METETIRVESATEYGYESGFVIEQYRYWNFEDHKSWCIAPWEEMGLGDLEGVFPTRAAAEAALASVRDILPAYA